MGGPKAQTLLARMGFNDPDLKSPSHDAMVLWVYEHIGEQLDQSSCTEIIQDDQVLARTACKNWLKQNDRLANSDKVRQVIVCGMPVPRIEPESVLEIVFEHPVTTKTQFIVGFIDVYVRTLCPEVGLVGIQRRRDGVPILESAEPPFLFVDQRKRHMYFEVKPRIPSLGELLRQIRTYQTYVGGTHSEFFVVSPDTRFRDAICQQGIDFWECPDL